MEGRIYEEVYEANYQRVYGAALRIVKSPHLAEEAAQEAFIKAYNNRNKLQDSNKLAAWLGRIATRTAIDIMRKERTRLVIPLDDLIAGNHAAVIGCGGADEEVEGLLRHRLLMEEVRCLASNLETVIIMKYMRGMKELEIAGHLGISLSAVKSRAHRARETLKKRLYQKHSWMLSA